MNKILEIYGDRFRYIKYNKRGGKKAWVLGIRGTVVDGITQKDDKIYGETFNEIIDYLCEQQ